MKYLLFVPIFVVIYVAVRGLIRWMMDRKEQKEDEPWAKN